MCGEASGLPLFCFSFFKKARVFLMVFLLQCCCCCSTFWLTRNGRAGEKSELKSHPLRRTRDICSNSKKMALENDFNLRFLFCSFLVETDHVATSGEKRSCHLKGNRQHSRTYFPQIRACVGAEYFPAPSGASSKPSQTHLDFRLHLCHETCKNTRGCAPPPK